VQKSRKNNAVKVDAGVICLAKNTDKDWLELKDIALAATHQHEMRIKIAKTRFTFDFGELKNTKSPNIIRISSRKISE